MVSEIDTALNHRALAGGECPDLTGGGKARAADEGEVGNAEDAAVGVDQVDVDSILSLGEVGDRVARRADRAVAAERTADQPGVLEQVLAGPAGQPVTEGAAGEQVIAHATLERVRAIGADHEVVATAAFEQIVAAFAAQRVLVGAAEELIVAGRSGQGIDAGAAVHQLAAVVVGLGHRHNIAELVADALPGFALELQVLDVGRCRVAEALELDGVRPPSGASMTLSLASNTK